MEYALSSVILAAIIVIYYRIQYSNSNYEKFEHYLICEVNLTLGKLILLFEFILQVGVVILVIWLFAQFIKLFL